MQQFGHRRSALVLAITCVLGFLWMACAPSQNAAVATTPDASAPRDAQAPPSSDGAAPSPTAEAGSDAPGYVPRPADAGPVTVFPAPAHGALFGAFVGAEPETQTDSESEALFTGEEALIDRSWVIDNRFYDDNVDWVNARTSWDITQQMVPLITWMPYGNGDPLNEIIAGTHDAAITKQAQEAKALGVQILMRWGHEMNGNWYPWSGSANGGADAGAAGGPAKYVAAYRHVHDIFVQVGATNVVWIWCINVADVPAEDWNHWTNYYPGDAYVDWVGLDAYNWGSSSSCCIWESFTDLVDSPYQDYAGTKPIMLPETASAEVGGDKGAWITAMHQAIETQYTDIKGVVWFDINKETDWRIGSSPGALAAYKAMALDPYFNP